MNDARLYLARFLLPMDAAPLEDAGLLVQDGRIAAVGRRRDLQRRHPGLPCTDFADAILLPPLVNAHTHLELTDFPNWADAFAPLPPDADFVAWILHLIAVKRAQTMNRFADALRHGLDLLLRSGTGAVADILSFPELEPLYAESPLLGRVDLELIGRGQVATAPLVARARQWLQSGGGKGLGRGLAPHAPYTIDTDLLGEVAELARSHAAPLTQHLAESAEEVELLQRGSGPLLEHLYASVGWLPPEPVGSPVDYQRQAEALRASMLLVHGVHLTADDIRQIALAGASIVLCPRSNRRLGAGSAPVAAFRCQGVNLALGTDSMASTDSLSLWDEMEAAFADYAPALSPVEILQIATVGGAKALRLEHELGTLSAASGAHFQVVRPAELLPPLRELPEFLCRGARGDEVTHLFLGGRDVLEESR